jgi:hypothetical protein
MVGTQNIDGIDMIKNTSKSIGWHNMSNVNGRV